MFNQIKNGISLKIQFKYSSVSHPMANGIFIWNQQKTKPAERMRVNHSNEVQNTNDIMEYNGTD